MKNIEKYKSLLETGEVDALLLTSEYNRLYAAQYNIAEGVAVVTKDGAFPQNKKSIFPARLHRSRAFSVSKNPVPFRSRSRWRRRSLTDTGSPLAGRRA